MQFRLGHLFKAVFVCALLAVAIKFVIERQPSISARVVLFLASPAGLGVGILALSLVQVLRAGKVNDACVEDVAKYKSLAWIGVVATMPLVIYVIYCCIVAPP